VDLKFDSNSLTANTYDVDFETSFFIKISNDSFLSDIYVFPGRESAVLLVVIAGIHTHDFRLLKKNNSIANNTLL
jgi:hypothetical protein